jgi:hypothetical protein
MYADKPNEVLAILLYVIAGIVGEQVPRVTIERLGEPQPVLEGDIFDVDLPVFDLVDLHVMHSALFGERLQGIAFFKALTF